MIFKVRDSEDGWVLIDDIYNVEIRANCFISTDIKDHLNIFKTPAGTKYVADIVFRDRSKTTLDSKDDNYTCICLFRTKNESILYAFNTIGYLTNDNGKTLEVLQN